MPPTSQLTNDKDGSLGGNRMGGGLMLLKRGFAGELHDMRSGDVSVVYTWRAPPLSVRYIETRYCLRP